MKNKITDILIEIAIIVFAVSLSLLLERWREKSEDHHLENTFISGLKTDLQTDLKELQSASSRYHSMKNAAHYFLNREKNITWSQDSIDFYGYELFHNVYFFPNSNRYESLKSTGKLGVIEDEKLQNNIIDLYQTKMPDLQQQISFFNDFMNNRVRDYLINNFRRNEQNNVVFDNLFFTNIQIRNILAFYGDLDDIQKRLDNVTRKAEAILKEIDQYSEQNVYYV